MLNASMLHMLPSQSYGLPGFSRFHDGICFVWTILLPKRGYLQVSLLLQKICHCCLRRRRSHRWTARRKLFDELRLGLLLLLLLLLNSARAHVQTGRYSALESSIYRCAVHAIHAHVHTHALHQR